jgi:thiol-disulfide isomerase/thioredoxin
MKSFLLFAILLFSWTFAVAQNEQAPILEKEFDYKNWTYKKVNGEGEVNLREFMKGKKLVLVIYYAPWCHNWKYEAPFVQKFYEKYKDKGFDVIGVGEYDTVDAMKADIERKKITFPVVYESDSLQAKQKTTHYEYRKASGDTRNWGSPFNVFLLPENLKKDGGTLAKKMFVVSGELIEAEAEAFIREKLGLPKEEKKEVSSNKAIEACEPTTTSLKKPE